MELRDKLVLITGGARGIGRAVVEQCAARGARPAVFDIDADALADLRKALTTDVHTYTCDVADPEQVASQIETLTQQLGPVHVLVNNAGLVHNQLLLNFGPTGLESYDATAWQRVINTNLNAVFYMTATTARQMLATRTRGVIVNISSICAAGNLGQCAYSAAKAGVDALTVTWAKELSRFGIRVVGVAPGFTETDRALSTMSADVIADWKTRTPLRRMATPAEIAAAVTFTIENDFFNGRVLPIDGGLRI